jgi:hypothetical protein
MVVCQFGQREGSRKVQERGLDLHVAVALDRVHVSTFNKGPILASGPWRLPCRR